MLSEYENMVNFYLSLMEAYGWTRADADRHSLEWVLDMLIVKAKTNVPEAEKLVPADLIF
jgi:hypothetical protein